MLVHLTQAEGYGLMPGTKSGPALADHGALAPADALKNTVTDMLARLRRSLTLDRGKEPSDHARFTAGGNDLLR